MKRYNLNEPEHPKKAERKREKELEQARKSLTPTTSHETDCPKGLNTL